MNKQTYYVNLQSLDISPLESKKDHSLAIYATQSEKEELESIFDDMRTDDFMTLLRSVVPVKPYHEAEHNKHFMESYELIFLKIYALGTEETKTFIKETGILNDRRIVKGESYPGRQDKSE